MTPPSSAPVVPPVADSARPAPPTPPQAKRQRTVHQAHGEIRPDDHHWLRTQGPEDPEVLAYLQAENAHLDAIMAPLRPLQDELYDHMLARVQQTDQGPPVPWGGWQYYTRTEEGRAHAIYCRQPRGGGPEQVLLDLNDLIAREGLANAWVNHTRPSPDGRLWAYLIDTQGHDQFTLRVLDTQSGQDLPDRVPDLSGWSLAWSADASRLYYARQDATLRAHEVWRHTLGAAPDRDERLYHEADQTFRIGVGTSASGDEVLLQVTSTLTSEWHHLRAADNAGQFQVIWPRARGVQYTAEDGGDHWLILTDQEEAREFKLLRVPKDGGPASEIISHDERRTLGRLSVFRQFLLVSGREGGLTQLWVLRRQNGEYVAGQRASFAEEVYTVRVGANHDFDARVARILYTSLTVPVTHYDLDLVTLDLNEVKTTPVPDYDFSQYVARRLWVTARDGVRVPVSLVYRRDTPPGAPTLLYGYGSYGFPMDPGFSASRLALLDRGWVYAIAHVRGGGELGEGWYRAGKLNSKMNTFTDFIDCAEHLIHKGVTRPERLVAMGRSAGGLLMGAVVNLRPDLFRAAFVGVPFVDVLSTMFDASIPLTTAEYDEWGNPGDPASYVMMRAYSPYDNLKATAHPHLFVSTGLHDPRVAYWEPAKYVARLRTLETGPNQTVLKTNLGAGHGGSSGRYEALRETAEEYAFAIAAVEGRLPQTPPPPPPAPVKPAPPGRHERASLPAGKGKKRR